MKRFLSTVVVMVSVMFGVQSIAQETELHLHKAVNKGRADIVRLLIEDGEIVNAKDDDGVTPLHFAAINGHYHITKL